MKSSWKKVKIGQLGRIVTGKTPKTSDSENYGGKIPFLTPTDDMLSKFVLATERTLTEQGVNSVRNQLLPAGAVAVSCIGSQLGKVTITTKPTVTNQQINSIIVDESNFDNDFVYYAMSILGKRLRYVAGVSTAVPIVNKSSFSQYEVLVPDIEEQRKISSVLSALDDKIAINKAINKNLEATAQAIFQDMFIGNYDPNWKNGTIDDLGTIVSGGTPSTTKPEHYCANGIPWITPKDLSLNSSKFIYRGKIDISEFGLKNSSAKILPKGSVLFSSRAPIGYIAIAANDVTTNQGFKSIIPADEIGTAFVYFFLKQSLSIIEGRASGSTFKEVSGTTMKSVPAVIPDVKKLNEFNLLCVPIFNKQKKVEAENQRLAAIRDALLPKLMSGEIDVSQVKI